MVKVRKDLTGMVFGRLTVLKQAEDYIVPKTNRHYPQWLCECSCKDHNKVIVMSNRLTAKNGTKSCGCITKELSSARMTNNVATYNRNNKRKTNPVNLDGEYGIGWTLNTNAEFYFDLEDYDKIKCYCWGEHIAKNGYHALEARDRQTGNIVRMHWVIVGKHYDHENNNPLDNRKSNLRIASQQENCQNNSLSRNNTSGYTGVSWSNRDQKWMAYIRADNKQKFLGYFQKKEDAIRVRLIAEAKYYGEFSPQIHLFEEYGIDMEV